MPILPNFFVPSGAEIWEEGADLLETTESGQLRGSSIHDAVHVFLEGLNLGNTGAGVTPPGADIREEVTLALETEPGPALASFIHNAFHVILDDLNLGTIGSFIHEAVHEILDLNLGNTGAGVTSSSDFIEPNTATTQPWALWSPDSSWTSSYPPAQLYPLSLMCPPISTPSSILSVKG
jgi:hypothetical protein